MRQDRYDIKLLDAWLDTFDAGETSTNHNDPWAVEVTRTSDCIEYEAANRKLAEMKAGYTSIKDVAKRLGMSRENVGKLARCGHFPDTRHIEFYVWYSEASVEKFLTSTGGSRAQIDAMLRLANEEILNKRREREVARLLKRGTS